MSARCVVDACPRPRKYKTMCGTHYERVRVHGDLDLHYSKPGPCAVDDCPRTALAVGLCNTHYKRVARLGTTQLPAVPGIAERLAARTVKTDTCWLWQGKPDRGGYGRLSINNRTHYAHRLSYQVEVGPIPVGLTIDHLCRVGLCIRPIHLEVVTLAENTRREMQALKRLREGSTK